MIGTSVCDEKLTSLFDFFSIAKIAAVSNNGTPMVAKKIASFLNSN